MWKISSFYKLKKCWNLTISFIVFEAVMCKSIFIEATIKINQFLHCWSKKVNRTCHSINGDGTVAWNHAFTLNKSTLHSYTLLLHYTATRHSYTTQLHSTATLHCYTPQLHYTATLYCYTSLLHATATLHSPFKLDSDNV